MSRRPIQQQGTEPLELKDIKRQTKQALLAKESTEHILHNLLTEIQDKKNTVNELKQIIEETKVEAEHEVELLQAKQLECKKAQEELKNIQAAILIEEESLKEAKRNVSNVNDDYAITKQKNELALQELQEALDELLEQKTKEERAIDLLLQKQKNNEVKLDNDTKMYNDVVSEKLDEIEELKQSISSAKQECEQYIAKATLAKKELKDAKNGIASLEEKYEEQNKLDEKIATQKKELEHIQALEKEERAITQRKIEANNKLEEAIKQKIIQLKRANDKKEIAQFFKTLNIEL